MLHHNRGGANDRRQATCKRLNNGNGPMSTSSATNRNTQAATTIRKIGGHACSKVGLNRLQQGSANGIAEYVATDLSRTTIKGAKLRHPVRVRHRPNVKHEIRFKRNAVLVSETRQPDCDPIITLQRFGN